MYFDDTATTYDQLFTYSEIGKRQRKLVWDYLEQVLPEDQSWKILELNCGTGEDALFFGKNGHKVLATDISEKMVEVARQKVNQKGLGNLISTQALDIEKLQELEFDESFDLVFSNFGGLNCLSKKGLHQMAKVLPGLLKPSGRFIAVVMPRYCLWEHFYFLFKKPNDMFRRTRKSLMASGSVETWYYAPSQFKKLFEHEFDLIHKQPVGLALPPSYLEPFFAKRQNWLSLLDKFESGFNGIPVFSNVADHFLIDLKLK